MSKITRAIKASFVIMVALVADYLTIIEKMQARNPTDQGLVIVALIGINIVCAVTVLGELISE